MSLVPLAVRSTVLALTFVPRLYRTLLWRILLSAEVPLAITAPLGAALAVLLFWAPAAILIPTAAPWWSTPQPGARSQPERPSPPFAG